MKYALAAVGALLLCSQPAFSHEFDYVGVLTGPTAGTGTVHVHADLDVITMQVQVLFSGLSSPVTGAQIHGRTAVPGVGTAGIATPMIAFPLGVTSGSDNETVNIALPSAYAPGFISDNGGTTGTALDAFALGLEDGRMYFEIQTVNFPGGEVRGFLTLVPAPEPGSLALLTLGGFLLVRRRR